MTNPISHNTPPPLTSPASSNSGSSQPAVTASRSGAASTSGKSDDQVQLTDSALALQNAARSDEGAVDAQRVAQVRAAIADGSYVINPGRIAEKMLALEAQLAGIGEG